MARKVDINRYTDGLCEQKIGFFIAFLNIDVKLKNHRAIFCDIMRNNDCDTFEEYIALFFHYRDTDSMCEKLFLRYGEKGPDRYKNSRKQTDIDFYTSELDDVKKQHFLVFTTLKIKKQKKNTIFSDILKNNDLDSFDEYLQLFHEYCSIKNSLCYRKIKIRFGDYGVEITKRRLASRPQSKASSGILIKEYWMNKGFTEEEAKNKIHETAKKLGTAGSKNRTYPAKGEFAKQLKYSKAYWIDRGYTLEEAKELQKPHLLPMINTLEGYEYRCSTKEEAQKLFDERNARRLKTMIDRYGTTVVTCRTSKESLRFFINVYKKLRKAGIKRDDIMWGVAGSKEFATRYDEKNYMYDFTVLSKKIIVEYHNTFWHVHEDHDFNNPFLSKTDVLEKDLLKKHIAESLGFQILYVWNFEDLVKKIDEICKVILDER